MENMLLLMIALLLWMIACLFLQNGSKSEQMGVKLSSVLVEKLSSRKLWAAIGVFVTGITTALHIESLSEEQVETICYSISGFLAFILAEGYADGHSPTNKIDEIVKEEGKKNE